MSARSSTKEMVLAVPPIKPFFFFFFLFFFFYVIIFIVLTVQEFACSRSYGVNKTTKNKTNKHSKKQYPYPPLLP